MDEAEIRRRTEQINNDPRMQGLISRLWKLPFWFFSGASLLPLVLYKYLPRNDTGRLKRLHLFGTGLFGGLVGLQVGLWRAKRYYRQVDPQGTLLREVEELLQMRSQKRPPAVDEMIDKSIGERRSEDTKDKGSPFADGLFSDVKK